MVSDSFKITPRLAFILAAIINIELPRLILVFKFFVRILIDIVSFLVALIALDLTQVYLNLLVPLDCNSIIIGEELEFWP